MPTKKTTTKKTEKMKWDKIKSVEASPEAKKEAEATEESAVVPFGRTVQDLITKYRQHIKENPIEQKGKATSPEGNEYNYFLSGDVFDHAAEFCVNEDAFLEQEIRNEGDTNVFYMHISLNEEAAKHQKTVSVNLGKPQNLGDFGARITYAPKYLVAVMFGITVQTDADAYRNGVIISNNDNDNENGQGQDRDSSYVISDSDSVGSDRVSNLPSNGDTNRNDNNDIRTASTPVSTTGGNTPTPTVEPSPSFIAAKTFIDKSQSEQMLKEAEVKLGNSSRLSQEEKDDLASLIAVKRGELTT